MQEARGRAQDVASLSRGSTTRRVRSEPPRAGSSRAAAQPLRAVRGRDRVARRARGLDRGQVTVETAARARGTRAPRGQLRTCSASLLRRCREPRDEPEQRRLPDPLAPVNNEKAAAVEVEVDRPQGSATAVALPGARERGSRPRPPRNHPNASFRGTPGVPTETLSRICARRLSASSRQCDDFSPAAPRGVPQRATTSRRTNPRKTMLITPR